MTNQTGLLWQDNDPAKTWQQKVLEAAERHRERLFLWPNRCYVNGKTVNPKLVIFNSGAFVEEIEGIQVYLHDGYQPNYFFVFFEGKLPVTEPARAPYDQPSPQLALF